MFPGDHTILTVADSNTIHLSLGQIEQPGEMESLSNDHLNSSAVR
jgi:hypothetical protein